MSFNLKGRSTARLTRDGVLFIAGLAGIGYETLITQVDRPTLLILFGGMVGLPAFLRTDEKQSDAAKPPDPGPDDKVTGVGGET